MYLINRADEVSEQAVRKLELCGGTQDLTGLAELLYIFCFYITESISVIFGIIKAREVYTWGAE